LLLERAVNTQSPIASFTLHLALLSLVAVGGVNTIVPELHRQTVEVTGALTNQQFADLFAIAQAAPGPNVLFVTLIGWQLAGLTGAMLATAALTVPTCTIAYLVTRAWDRFRDAPWRIATQAGLVPVTIGFIAASAYLLARAADNSLVAFAITAATAAIAFWSRINPLWALAAAAAIGFAGLV
jgi:chromate transporter